MKGHVSSLNGLRGLSILMVIFNHLMQQHYLPENIYMKYAGWMLFNGQLGVNIFFISSGFLITSLLIKEKTYTGGISLKKFYSRRVIRILPAYYFLLLVYFVLDHAGYFNLSTLNWFSILTCTKQFFPDTNYETFHLWAISVEELFYLFWPFIFIQSSKIYKRVVWLLIAVVVTVRIFQYAYPVPVYNNYIGSTGDALLVGCLFAVYNDTIVAWLTAHKKWRLFVLPSILACVFIYNYLCYSDANSVQQMKPAVLHNLRTIAYAFAGNIGLITNLLVGLFLLISINVKDTLWFTFLNTRPLEITGRLSYSLYLWQQLFTAENFYRHQLSWIVILMIIFVCAAFSYYLIERSFFRFKSKLGFIEYN